jgi:hypothetical protein
MSSLREFRCEICGTTTTSPLHWFVIRCGESELTVLRWKAEAADTADARHCAAKQMLRFASAAGSIQCVPLQSPTS